MFGIHGHIFSCELRDDVDPGESALGVDRVPGGSALFQDNSRERDASTAVRPQLDEETRSECSISSTVGIPGVSTGKTIVAGEPGGGFFIIDDEVWLAGARDSGEATLGRPATLRR